MRNFVGDYVTAAEHADRASRLSPFDPYTYLFSLARGTSHLLRRQLPEAVALAAQVGPGKPTQRPDILVARQCAGARRTDGGRPGGDPAPAGIASDEHCELERQRRRLREEDIEYVIEGARLAGLPE